MPEQYHLAPIYPVAKYCTSLPFASVSRPLKHANTSMMNCDIPFESIILSQGTNQNSILGKQRGQVKFPYNISNKL